MTRFFYGNLNWRDLELAEICLAGICKAEIILAEISMAGFCVEEFSRWESAMAGFFGEEIEAHHMSMYMSFFRRFFDIY